MSTKSNVIEMPPQGVSPETLDQVVERFNKKYFVIGDYGSRCVVGWWKRHLNSNQLRVQDVRHFLNFFKHTSVVVSPKTETRAEKTKSHGDAWYHDPRRRTFDYAQFTPGQGEVIIFDGDKYLNLWEGFPYKPIEGNGHLGFLEHLFLNICRGNQEHYDWLIRYYAYALQHPDEQGHSAIVFQGDKGVGKTFAAKRLGDLWGNHSMLVSRDDLITGRFNGHLETICMLIGDETFCKKSRANEAVLKSLITDETLPIEHKFFNTEICKNYLHLVLISNNDWVVPASVNERRFFVLRAGNGRRKDTDYFHKLQQQLNDGGYSNLMHHLSSIKLGDWNPRNPLETEWLDIQKEHTLHGIEKLWLECLLLGEVCGNVLEDGGVTLNASTFLDWASEKKKLRCDFTTLRNFLGAGERGMGFATGRTGSTRQRVWMIPRLADARRIWCERTKMQPKWPEDTAAQGELEPAPADQWVNPPGFYAPPGG